MIETDFESSLLGIERSVRSSAHLTGMHSGPAPLIHSVPLVLRFRTLLCTRRPSPQRASRQLTALCSSLSCSSLLGQQPLDPRDAPAAPEEAAVACRGALRLTRARCVVGSRSAKDRHAR